MGAALVGLVLSDVFRTVVLPRPARRGLRLGPPLRAGALRVWKALMRRLPPEARDTMLGTLGPLLVVAELTVWVGMLVLGYGLLLHALGDGMTPAPGYADAFYAAGGSFLTLGVASPQEAVSAPVRFVVLLAGGSGLTIVTLVVTFLLSVQGALQQREALVVRLRARTGPTPSGRALLDTHARLSEEHEGTLREFFTAWEEWCADVLLTHRAFPILAYFRSNDEDCGWLAALGAVLALGLGVLSGLLARDALRWSLERRGYLLAEVVVARDPEAALARLLHARADLRADAVEQLA